MREWVVPLYDLDYGAEEEEAALRVLRSRWLTTGPEVEAFEREFAAALSVRRAVAVASGTAALHLALLAAGVGPGDEVLQPAINFVAAANMTIHVGASPVFVDITGPRDPTIDPADVARRISPRTRALIAMHYGGYLCRMDELRALCDRHRLALIEDACHAVGAPGAAVHGDLACFSFYSNKNLATGQGGMVVTGRDALADRITSLRGHGITTPTWDRHRAIAHRYDVAEHGFNYRLDELRAALGRAQLARLAANNERRARLVEAYHASLRALPGWQLPFADRAGDGAHHLMAALAPDPAERERVAEALRERGIQTSLHYPSIPRLAAFAARPPADVPRSDDFAARVLTLPLFPRMTLAQVEHVSAALRAAATAAP